MRYHVKISTVKSLWTVLSTTRWKARKSSRNCAREKYSSMFYVIRNIQKHSGNRTKNPWQQMWIETSKWSRRGHSKIRRKKRNSNNKYLLQFKNNRKYFIMAINTYNPKLNQSKSSKKQTKRMPNKSFQLKFSCLMLKLNKQ